MKRIPRLVDERESLGHCFYTCKTPMLLLLSIRINICFLPQINSSLMGDTHILRVSSKRV